jgi:uncharacterized membrane-anchored protein
MEENPSITKSWPERQTARWRLAQLTEELNARPFPEFAAPTRLFRLCVKGREAFPSIRQQLSDVLDGVDWQVAEQGKIIRGIYRDIQVNIERHTEFTSLTLIEEGDETDTLAAVLPTGWIQALAGEIVVAVDCLVRHAAADQVNASVCASKFDGGRAIGYFDFQVASDGHTKIRLDVAPQSTPRDIGRIALQVLEIETYRCFAALGLPKARGAQERLWEIANLIPNDPVNMSDDAETAARYSVLSGLANELDQIGRDTSFRFNACQAYWALVQARLAALGEERHDARLTIGRFLERRLGPAIATYQSTARQRDNIADQVAKLSGLLQTRIELGLQQQNARLLTSLNEGSERQIRLQQTVEGVSVVAISYYTVGLLRAPTIWLTEAVGLAPLISDPRLIEIGIILVIVPLVWWRIHRLLRRHQ